MKNHILFIQWDMGDNSIQFFIIIFFTQNLFLWCKGHINLFPSSETWEITLHQILQQIFFTLNHFLLWRNHIILISYCETWGETPSALVQTSKSFLLWKTTLLRLGLITPSDSSLHKSFSVIKRPHYVVSIVRHGKITPQESSSLENVFCYEKPHYMI